MYQHKALLMDIGLYKKQTPRLDFSNQVPPSGLNTSVRQNTGGTSGLFSNAGTSSNTQGTPNSLFSNTGTPATPSNTGTQGTSSNLNTLGTSNSLFSNTGTPSNPLMSSGSNSLFSTPATPSTSSNLDILGNTTPDELLGTSNSPLSNVNTPSNPLMSSGSNSLFSTPATLGTDNSLFSNTGTQGTSSNLNTQGTSSNLNTQGTSSNLNTQGTDNSLFSNTGTQGTSSNLNTQGTDNSLFSNTGTSSNLNTLGTSSNPLMSSGSNSLFSNTGTPSNPLMSSGSNSLFSNTGTQATPSNLNTLGTDNSLFSNTGTESPKIFGVGTVGVRGNDNRHTQGSLKLTTNPLKSPVMSKLPRNETRPYQVELFKSPSPSLFTETPPKLNISQSQAQNPRGLLNADTYGVQRSELEGLEPVFPKIGTQPRADVSTIRGPLNVSQQDTRIQLAVNSRPVVNENAELIEAHQPGDSKVKKSGINWEKVNTNRGGSNSSYTTSQLQTFIRQMGGVPSGNKKDLVEQLLALNNQGENTDAYSYLESDVEGLQV